MLRLPAMLLFSLFVASVLAAPAPAADKNVQKRWVKVPHIRLSNYVPNGTVAIRKAYRKYGIVRTYDDNDLIHKRFGGAELNFYSRADAPNVKAANGTQPPRPAQPQNDAEFVSPINVGGQQIVMTFDSGSADMWVFNTGLPPEQQTGHTIYDPTKSPNSRAVDGATFRVSYGDGSFVNGPVGMDVVDIGGAKVDQQVMGLPNNASASFVEDTVTNGLIGLSFSSLNSVRPQPANTFFANAAPNLSQQVYTANLRNKAPGGYEFGRIDDTQFEGPLTVVPVDSTAGFWLVQSKQFSVNGGPPQPNTQSGTAIMDTGTSLMIADPVVVNGYYSQVQGAIDSPQVGGVVMPCDTPMPDLEVAIGDAMSRVSGQNMNFAEIGATNAQGQNMCFGGVQSNAGLANFQIFGDVYFKSNFASFQAGQPPSFGFAPHKGPGAPQ